MSLGENPERRKRVMRKKWIYRMGAVVIAGALAASDVSAVRVLAEDGASLGSDGEVEGTDGEVGGSDGEVGGTAGEVEDTVYQVGGVAYDIWEAEVSSEGTYCGIEWKLYDNGLMILTGGQTRDIGIGNYHGAPWRNSTNVKAVYLDFDTKGHALERMFWNAGILGATCGPDFCMTGTRNISHMFSGCSKLTEFDFTGQDFSSVVTMEDIFRGCSSITSITFGDGIDTGNLENLYQAFLQCGKLSYVDAWNLDVGKVTTLYSVFKGCGAITELDLSGWDVGQVTTTQYAFAYCTGLHSLNIRDWKMPNLQNAACMFDGASGLAEIDLSGWETSEKLNNIYAMFRYCRALKTVTFSADMDTSGVTNMAELFKECNMLESVDLSMFSTGSCTRAGGMFDNAKKLERVQFGEDFKLERATTVERMFYGCGSMTGLDLSMWAGGNLTDMSSLFYGCSGLVQVDFGGDFDAGTVKKMTRLFHGCNAMKSVDLSNWQVESLEDISYGFFGCDSLESVDLGGWGTENLTDINSLFEGNSRLKTVKLEGWNTEGLSSGSGVFQYCSGLQTVVTPTMNGTKRVSLPKKMYDWDDGDQEYSALPTGTSESITLHGTRSCSYTVEISAALALEPVEEGTLPYAGDYGDGAGGCAGKTLLYAGDYDVKVSGYCHADGKCIAVFPESGTVVLTGEGGDEVMGRVTQETRYLSSNVDDVISGMTDEAETRKWSGLSESGTEFTGEVTAEFEKPGNYSGTVNFRFGCYGYHFDADGKTVLEE